MKAFLTNDFYMKGSFSDKLKEIYTNVFTLLNRNLPEKVEYSDAHSFEYYVALEDDLNPVEELLAILPGSPYECDVMYYARKINIKMILDRILILKDEYTKYINQYLL